MSAQGSVRRRGRRLDALTRLLALLAARQPRLALALASTAGALRNRMTDRWPAVSEVELLFPHVPPREAVGIAAAIGALEERNDVFVRCVKRSGMERVRPTAVLPDALLNIEGPCILGTFHVGALHTVGVTLEALRKPVLAFRDGLLFIPRAPVALLSSKGGEQRRAAAFVRALGHLRQGGIVLMALDTAPEVAIETECLGHPLALARGPFVLARMTGAPIVPLAVQWVRRGTRVVLGDALASEVATDAALFESRLASAASLWLEHYLLDAPSEISLGLLRELLYRHRPTK